jgi:hypothetical protein
VPEGAPGKVLHEEATAAFQRLKREKERELNSIQVSLGRLYVGVAPNFASYIWIMVGNGELLFLPIKQFCGLFLF